MVRDEVDRVRSHYLMCVRNERAQRPAKQAVTLPPLAALLEAELRRIARCDATVPPLERFAGCYVNAWATCRFSSAVLPSTLRKGNRPGCFHLIAASLYALAIAPWVKTLGAANVLVVRKDDLQRRDAARCVVVGVVTDLESPSQANGLPARSAEKIFEVSQAKPTAYLRAENNF